MIMVMMIMTMIIIIIIITVLRSTHRHTVWANVEFVNAKLAVHIVTTVRYV